MYRTVLSPIFRNGNEVIKQRKIFPDREFNLLIQTVTTTNIVYYTIYNTGSIKGDLNGTMFSRVATKKSLKEIITIIGSTIVKNYAKRGDKWSPLYELTVVPISEGKIDYIKIKNCEEILLERISPNPFDKQDIIKLEVKKSYQTYITIYNIYVRKIKCVFNKNDSPGKNLLTLDGKYLSSVVHYIYFKPKHFLKLKNLANRVKIKKKGGNNENMQFSY